MTSKIVIRRGAAYDDITIKHAKGVTVLDRAAARQYDTKNKTRVEKDMIETVADIYVAEHGLNKDKRNEKRARDQKFKQRRRDD